MKGMYARSKQALLDLQKTLYCGKCDQRSEELLCLGNCQHWFCRSCAESNAGRSCPKCSIPSTANKMHVDVQLSNVASLCSQMMNLINGYSNASPIKDALRSHTPIKQGNIFDNGHFPHETPNEDKKCNQGDCNINFSLRKASNEINTDGKSTEYDDGDVKKIASGLLATPLTSSEKIKIKSKMPSKVGKRKTESVNNDHDDSNAESSGCNAFVKLKEISEPTDDDKSQSISGTNIFDIMAKITPETRKRRPQSGSRASLSEGKIKKAGETAMAGDKLTKEDHNATPQSAKSKKIHLSENTPHTYLELDSTTTATMIRKVTPQSSKKRQTNLCKRNAKGETSLQVATIKMNIDEVKRLLDAGANPNVKDNAGWTPLHEAVSHGNSDITALLIASGASVNAPGMDNTTPLHDAVVYQYLDCVRLLINQGADINSRNVHGQSCIDLATNDEIKNLLLSASQAHSVSNVDLPLLDESAKPLCFTGSNLSKAHNKLLIQYSRVMQAKIVQEITPEVTHLVTGLNDDGSCSRTYKYLSAVLAGKWIVHLQWLEECCKQHSRVSEHDFMVPLCTSHSESEAPRRAVENRLKQLPPLFDGCQVFFYGKFQSSSSSGIIKDQLVNLVKLGGGVILKREPRLHNLDDYPYTHPYHAQSPVSHSLADCTIYVVYDHVSCGNPPSVQAQRMACLPVSWLLDSIATFSLLEKAGYIMGCVE